MKNKSPYFQGYHAGLNNKPRNNKFEEFTAHWKAYEKGYDTGKKSRN